MYNMPLLTLVAIGGDYQTVTLGHVLLSDETTESFQYVLYHMLRSNRNLSPGVILSDADNAFTCAVEIVFQGSGVIHLR